MTTHMALLVVLGIARRKSLREVRSLLGRSNQHSYSEQRKSCYAALQPITWPISQATMDPRTTDETGDVDMFPCPILRHCCGPRQGAKVRFSLVNVHLGQSHVAKSLLTACWRCTPISISSWKWISLVRLSLAS